MACVVCCISSWFSASLVWLVLSQRNKRANFIQIETNTTFYFENWLDILNTEIAAEVNSGQKIGTNYSSQTTKIKRYTWLPTCKVRKKMYIDSRSVRKGFFTFYVCQTLKIRQCLTELLGTQKIKLEFDKVYVFQAPKARYILSNRLQKIFVLQLITRKIVLIRVT